MDTWENANSSHKRNVAGDTRIQHKREYITFMNIASSENTMQDITDWIYFTPAVKFKYLLFLITADSQTSLWIFNGY